MTTFEQALERAYQECWRLGQDMQAIEGYEESPGWDKAAAVTNARHILRGGQDVLGALLHLDGQIGLRKYPDAPTPVGPDPQQVQLRFLDWSLKNGHIKQEEYDHILAVSSQMQEVAGRLGEDFYL